MSDDIISFSKVQIGFGSTLVHRDISFSIKQGQSVTLLGPSGIGKTLILKMIMGLLQPTAGTIHVRGEEIQGLPEPDLREVRRHIGMLFQGAALFDSLTVFENVAYSLRERQEKSEEEIQDIVSENLRVIGLPNIGEKYPSELSGGQKKRVGLARALASSPAIVLFDEPTTGLDPTATRLIDELIIKLKVEYSMTCVSVTHDIASARRISDRWLLINDGIVAADGPVEEVTASHQDVINFISGNWTQEVHCV